MGSDTRLQDLSPAEILHERLMWEIVRRVRDMDYVLKGCCALVFASGISRHSTDIDFDAKKPTDMMRRIRNGLRAVGAVMTFQEPVPSRDALRIRINYRVRDEDEPVELKVDTRFRPRPVAAEVTFVNGIRTYKPDALFKQKLDAFDDRNKPRDLYDLAFLSKKYGDALTDAEVLRSEKTTRRMNKLARRSGPLFKNDSVLSRLATAEDTLLEFSEAVRLQIQQRSLWIQKQSLPVSRRMVDLIREIRAEFPRQRRDADSVKPARSNRPGRARPGLDRDSGSYR